jgi:YVTN family beta-propeller protein
MGDVFVANEGNNSISVIGAATNTLLSYIRVGASGENPSGITVDSTSGDVYAAVPSSGNVTVISECNSSTCPSISGRTPSCGSYNVVWPYPNMSPVLPGSPVTSSITTCTQGTGAWSITRIPSNVLVAAGTFACPCSDTLLFNYTAGVPPLTNGTYWLQESFNGNGFGVTFVVPSAY